MSVDLFSLIFFSFLRLFTVDFIAGKLFCKAIILSKIKEKN